MFGAVIARDEDYREVVQYLRPGEASGHRPSEIAYVGDRLDNDIRPAADADLYTVWVKRGPWGYISYVPGYADLEITTLIDLAGSLPT